MLRVYIMWLLVLCGITCCRATSLDSLYNVLSTAKSKSLQAGLLGQISFQLSSSFPDSAVAVARKGMNIAQSVNDEVMYAQCTNSLGWAYYRLTNNDTAAHYLTKSIKLFGKHHQVKDEGRGWLNLAMVYETEEKYELASKALLRARYLHEKCNDESGKAYADRMIGVIYHKQGHLKEAKIYLWSSYYTSMRINNLKNSSDAVSSLGSVYFKTNLDSAFWCFKKAISLLKKDIANTGVDNTAMLAYAYENLGVTFMKAGNQVHHGLDSAEYYITLARNMFTALHAKQDVAYENMNLASCLMEQKNYSKAEKVLLSTASTFDSLKTLNYAFQAYTILGEIYKHNREYKKALEYAEKASVLKDTLNSHNRNEILTDMLTKYESEKKDRTIALLDAQKKLADKELVRNKLVNMFSIVIIILLVLFVFTLLNRHRIKRELQDFKIRDQLSSDLHDDIGSSLSSILLLSKMGDSKSLINVSNHDIVSRINANARTAMDKMSDIVWTTNPKFDEGSSLRDRIEKHIQQIRSVTGINIIFAVPEELDNYRFPMEVRKNIFLIVKEAVTNALKHASATTIRITIALTDKNLLLAIQDDGCGFEKMKVNNGLGMVTMQTRSKDIAGALSISSDTRTGTEVCLSMPVSKYKRSKIKR